MTALSPIPPTAAYTRETQPHLSTATRHVAPVSPVESARAVQPVDSANNPELVRNQTNRDRPAGPPPTFDISILQDLYERMSDPVEYLESEEPVSYRRDGAETIPQDTTRAADEEPSGVSDEGPRERPDVPDITVKAMSIGTSEEAPHMLDKKV